MSDSKNPGGNQKPAPLFGRGHFNVSVNLNDPNITSDSAQVAPRNLQYDSAMSSPPETMVCCLDEPLEPQSIQPRLLHADSVSDSPGDIFTEVSPSGIDEDCSGDVFKSPFPKESTNAKPVMQLSSQIIQAQQQEAIDAKEATDKFMKLSNKARIKVMRYYSQLARCAYQYARHGDPKRALHNLFEDVPEVLLAYDNGADSTLGRALLNTQSEPANFYIKLAKKTDFAKRVFEHRNTNRHSLLMFGVDFNNDQQGKEILEQLVEYDPTQLVRYYDNEGKNVFHYCAEEMFSQSLKIILDLLHRKKLLPGSELFKCFDMPDNSGRTPVLYMAENGDLKSLQVLHKYSMEIGFKVNYNYRQYFSKSEEGATPLTLAVCKGHVEVCRWLLELEKQLVNVNHTQKNGLSALHLAVENKNEVLISLLVKHGANPNLKSLVDEENDMDSDEEEEFKRFAPVGLTPLEMAQSGKLDSKIISILQDNGGNSMDSGIGSSVSSTLSFDEITEKLSQLNINTQEDYLNLSKDSEINNLLLKNDLHLFSDERRKELEKALGAANKVKAFITALEEFGFSKYTSEILKIVDSPVYLALSMFNSNPEASRLKIAIILKKIDEEKLIDILKNES